MPAVARKRAALSLLLASAVACSNAAGVAVERADTAPGVTTSSTPPPTASPSTDPPAPPTTLPDVDDGVGDELFPTLGNLGIDVQHYDATFRYDPSTADLDGVVTLTIEAERDLSAFSLDSTAPQVSGVELDGEPVDFREDDPKLRITPREPIAAGTRFEVAIAYRVRAGTRPSPTGFDTGWFTSGEGSFVLNEPDGARHWMPSNDHPSDKATYRFTITVPAGFTAVANGALVEHTTGADGETWVWDETDPMTTYLILLLTGDYELVEGTGPGGLPLLSVVLRRDREAAQPFIDGIGRMIEFFEPLLGPYPLARYGLAITDSFGGLAMETQGRSLFSRDDFVGSGSRFVRELLLAHELVHQWFGNAVSPARWTDIWLNESFATYGQWLWLDHLRLTTVEQEAEAALAGRSPRSIATPPVTEMFGFNSYDGGAATLHALRLTIGDDAFFALLQRWAADNYGESRTTADFVALAEQVAGADLTAFFDEWLFSDRPPRSFPEADQAA